MTTQSSHAQILKSSLRNRLGLPHQHCLLLINAHLTAHKDDRDIDISILDDQAFIQYLDALSSKLTGKIETNKSNPLAIIANRNYRALLPSELTELYDFSLEASLPPQELDKNYLIQRLGTLEQVFTATRFTQNPYRFDILNFRQLFKTYVNIHQQSNGQYLVVVRELDSLAYSSSIPNSIQVTHMNAVVQDLIREANKSKAIGTIAFENINNIHSLSKNTPFFDEEVRIQVNANFQELTAFRAKRDVLAFDCSVPDDLEPANVPA